MSLIKKTLISGSGIFLAAFFLLPQIGHADSVMINKENTDGVNIRAEKSNDAEIYGIVRDYTPIEVIDSDDTWIEISYEGKPAYLGKSYFFDLTDSKLIKKANLKAKDDKDSSNLLEDDLEISSVVTILGFSENEDFVKVSYRSEDFDNKKINSKRDLEDEKDPEEEPIIKEGYIRLSSLDLSEKSKKDLADLKEKYKEINEKVDKQREEEAQEDKTYEEVYYVSYLVDENGTIIENSSSDLGASIYNHALSYLGSPYVFGGLSKDYGIDCSGLVLRVYEAYGLSLPHLAKAQANYGQNVAFGSEKAGDLVFFGSSYSDIYHVGIADGRGNMVHAASPGQGVIVSPIYDPFLIKRILE
ncbi:MAG: SH3 domain-containing C40 family peptidase [Anaerococcus sp.]|nr:SH3 domain-containing C40 family peptidase [Anaerococcus sp.]